MKAVGHVHPEFGGEVERVESLAEMVEKDGRSSTLALRTEVNPDAVFETVNFSVFPKGRAVLDMVEAWIGPARVTGSFPTPLEVGLQK